MKQYIINYILYCKSKDSLMLIVCQSKDNFLTIFFFLSITMYFKAHKYKTSFWPGSDKKKSKIFFCLFYTFCYLKSNVRNIILGIFLNFVPLKRKANMLCDILGILIGNIKLRNWHKCAKQSIMIWFIISFFSAF